MENQYVPRSLKYLVRELSAIRTSLRVQSSSANTANPNSILRIRFPEGIIDLSTITMRCLCTLSGVVAATSSARIPPLYKLIQKFTAYAGGTQLHPQNNYYNIVKNAILKSSCSDNLYPSRALHGYMEDQYSFTANTAVNTSAYLIEDQFLGLNTTSFYNSGVFGVFELELTFATADYLKFVYEAGAAQTGRGSVSYSLTNIDFVVDRVMPPRVYIDALDEQVRMGAPVQLAYMNVISRGSTNNGSNRENIDARCLDTYMVMPITLYNASTQAPGNAFEGNQFIYNSGATTSNLLYTGSYNCSLRIGTNQIPENGTENALYLYDYSTHCWNHGSIDSYNMLALPTNNYAGAPGGTVASIDNWATCKHIISMDLTLEGQGWAHPDGVLSGVNCYSSQVDIIWTTSGYSSSIYWLQNYLCTSVLKYQAGKLELIP